MGRADRGLDDTTDVVSWLRDAWDFVRGRPDANGVHALHKAVRNGDLDGVKFLLQNGRSMHETNWSGETAFSHAVRKGHLNVVQEFIRNGADIEETDKEGRTALSCATECGHVHVVKALFRAGAGAGVNAEDKYGRTALSHAAKSCHVDVARVLIKRGAAIEAKDSDGWTPLFHAAECGQMDMVRTLIKHGASVSVKSKPSDSHRGVDTPLTLAGRAGHMKVFQALIEAGAPINVRSGSGETPLISAARWDFFAGVQMLFAGGNYYLREENVSENECPLLDGSLATMRQMCRATFEFESICAHFWIRLRAICVHCQYSEDARDKEASSSVVSFANVLFRFCRLLLEIENRRNRLSRFIGSRAITNRIQDFHEELDHFAGTVEYTAESDWKQQWTTEKSLVHARFEVLQSASFRYWRSVELNFEVAVLLQYELKTCCQEGRPDFEVGIARVLERFLQTSGTVTPVLPEWFISHDDVEFHSWNIVRSERQINYYEGKWQKTSVMIETSDLGWEEFAQAASQWHKVSHPNVVKLFGACHVGSRKFFAYEMVPEGKPLYEVLSERSTQRLSKWKCLYEAALGLQHIRNRGAVHMDLRSENIVVGSDLVTKLTGLRGKPYRLYFSNRSGLNWMAPEQVPLKAPVSAASNIYAFGMCIWEAVILDLPWKNKDALAIFDSVSRGKLPGRPGGIDDRLWELITKMCAPDPNSRVNITFVVNRLKQFVFRDEKIGKGVVTQVVSWASGSTKIMDEHVFGELGDTIPNALEAIYLKSKMVADNAWMLTIVCPALRYIFALLREHQKAPEDIEVAMFCTALVRFQRYLRTALSEKSMYQLARSRRVAESHHLVYAGLDRLLDMLDVPETDGIRVWRLDPCAQAKPQGVAIGLEANANSSIYQASAMSKAVVLKYFDTPSTNHHLWTRMDLANSMTQASWYLPLRDLVYSELDQIGQGAFGAVYKGSWLGTPIVVKFMGYEEDFDTISTDLLLHEVRVWHRLNHPHVLKLYGACHSDKRYFVCEYASNGDLTEFLKKPHHKHLTWQKLYEVALGLQYLHRRNIAHNDLKCDNIMVGADGKAKVIDFGLSSLLNEAEIQIELKKMGAVNWRSPEYLAGGRPSFASDVYSFAMCIIEAVSGEIPWGKPMIGAQIRLHLRKGRIPYFESPITKKQRNLIRLMTKFDPSERVKLRFVVDKMSEIAQDEQRASGATNS